MPTPHGGLRCAKRPPEGGLLSTSAAAAATDAAGRAAGGGDGVGREELVHGELDLTEHIAGVLLAALLAAAAVLGGDAVVVSGDEQLGIALHADDGELAQGNEHPVQVAVGHQLVAEAGGHRHGDVHTAAVAGAALADIHQLQAQDQRIHRLHYPHQIGKCLDSVHVI